MTSSTVDNAFDAFGGRPTFDTTADILSAFSSASEEGLAIEGTIRKEVTRRPRWTGSYTLGSCLSIDCDVSWLVGKSLVFDENREEQKMRKLGGGLRPLG